MEDFESNAVICIYIEIYRPMNKIFKLFLPLIILSISSCKNCDSYYPTVTSVASCFFKTGSYFVYIDSIDHIVDSQYVFQYNYQARGNVIYVYDQCYTYVDIHEMNMRSYRNGLFYDSIYSLQKSDPTTIRMFSAKGYFTQFDQAISMTDTPISNFSVAGHVYPSVYKRYPSWYLCEGPDTVYTDQYFAPGYGIVKRVEHRHTGDVSWDLIRSHIVQ